MSLLLNLVKNYITIKNLFMKESILTSEVFENIMENLVNRAKESNEFKIEFISDPIRVIENYAKVKVDKNLSLSVDDQTDINTIYFNIPRRMNLDDTLLSQEELDLITGGRSPIYCIGRGAKHLYNYVLTEVWEGIKDIGFLFTM